MGTVLIRTEVLFATLLFNKGVLPATLFQIQTVIFDPAEITSSKVLPKDPASGPRNQTLITVIESRRRLDSCVFRE